AALARAEAAEAELRPALERLNLATQAAGIGVWDRDLINGTVTGDETFWQLLDSPEPEPTVDIYHRNVPEEDRAAARQQIQALIDDPARRQEMVSSRHRVLLKNGAVRHLQRHAKPVFDPSGKLIRLLGVTWDVTEEVLRTEHQKKLVNCMSIACDSAGISIWEFDIETRRITWDTNRPAAYGLGHVPLDQLADEFHKIVHPEDLDIVLNSRTDALAQGKRDYAYRFRVARAGNPIRHMQVFARSQYDAQDKPRSVVGVTWDVTNEVQTTDMLQRQAEQERALTDRFNIAMQAAGIRPWEMAFSPTRYVWSDNFDREWLDEQSEDLVTAVVALTHPDDRDVFRNCIKAAMESNTDTISYRYRFLNRDGTWDHRQNFVRLFFNEQGKPVRALGATLSVTKEVEATEQLRAAERRLERASLSSSEGHWEWDLVTQLAWHSDSFHALLGYPHGALVGPMKPIAKRLRHPEDYLQYREKLNRHVNSGDSYSLEARFHMANGEYRWFLVRGTSELGPDGKPLRVAGSIQDIHQQKLAEDALRLAQRRFERAINGTQDGLWEFEVDSDEAWYSPRCAELLQLKPQELPNKMRAVISRLHPDDIAIANDATIAHFRANVPYDIEIRLRSGNDEYRWYRARAVAERDPDGKPLRLSGSLQDVTEARAAREELVRATEEAQSANKAKSAFLANVSHEIRTPMNGIIGMTGLLMEMELDRTQREYAETIRGSADSLLTIINDILDFSKIEAGKLEIESIETDLRGNVEDVGAMMAFQASAKTLELIVNVEPTVPQHVLGDPQRIRQCLINLVGNAIKFTRSGEVVIDVRCVGEADGKVITRFEVRDTGIGIGNEALKNLFQPFTQADSSTTRHYGGTGLGLSIVRRLAEMMGGRVGADSNLGSGSTFWFELPLRYVNTPTLNAPISDGLVAAVKGRILIVDDNHTNRRVLLGQLEHAGYEVDAVSNGADALTAMRQALADNRSYELALIDFQMPDMDGAMLGERINADAHLSRTRVIMLTSMDRHGDVGQFAAMGFAGYLSKPVRARELLDCIDRVLAREARDWHSHSQPLVTRNALNESKVAQRFSGRVLLVEDNVVNQKVAQQFLKRLGCEVLVAENGIEGVKAYETGQFDIVLMDLQMPVMDGYAATRRIRDFQGWGKRVPIVALTANAMPGQLERCLAAGMDDFLTKPLDVKRLREVLDKFGLGVPDPIASTTGNSADTPSAEIAALLSRDPAIPPVNLARLDEITDGDVEFTQELIAVFVASSAQVVAEMHTEYVKNNRAALGRAAHKLKGASANIHASALQQLCAVLEAQVIELPKNALANHLAAIETAIGDVVTYLREARPATPKANVA
ncbi:MAG: PAS domain-containing protein, partial [Candidatus Obscuribacterales bacterium]|nr:PAS domain-containing protein [Steroidobacteraceae bacterium]